MDKIPKEVFSGQKEGIYLLSKKKMKFHSGVQKSHFSYFVAVSKRCHSELLHGISMFLPIAFLFNTLKKSFRDFVHKVCQVLSTVVFRTNETIDVFYTKNPYP